MSQGKIPAIALLITAMLPLSLFLVSISLAWRALIEAQSSSSDYFFRICSTTSSAECTTFTWLHLTIFCAICFSTGVLLARQGIKKWKSTSA
jgi:hypothetical protein